VEADMPEEYCKETAEMMPCEQGDVIASIKKTVEQNRAAADRSSQRIEESISSLVKQQERFILKLESVLIEDREHKVRIEKLEKNEDILFNLIRGVGEEHKECVEKKLNPLITWRADLDGKLSALKAIPIACVIITTLIAVYTFSYSIKEEREFHKLSIAAPYNSKKVGIQDETDN
jgi:hypothetical protein